MSKKILVIDDNEAILDAIQAFLEMEGYQVVTSIDGSYVDSLLSSSVAAPDAIISDVFLSGTDGRSLCKKLKQNENTKDIPVIMISALPNVRESVLEAGADDFIAKPFSVDAISSALESQVIPPASD